MDSENLSNYALQVKEARSQIIQAAAPYPYLHWALKYHVNTKGEPLQFNKMFYLLHLYKNFHLMPRMAVIKAAQMGLSELFISASHQEAAKGLSVFYVLPKYELRNRFVSNRVFTLHKRSMHYHGLLIQAKKRGGSYRTALIHFGKGGISYVGSNVDTEFVEIPVDSAFIDELDKCNQANLQLVPSRLGFSDYKYIRKISNPTIEDVGIDAEYKSSSQADWLLKCEHCNAYIVPDFFKHFVRQIDSTLYEPLDKRQLVGAEDYRLICDKCHRPVDRLQRGQWVERFPDNLYKGFRLGREISAGATIQDLVNRWNAAAGSALKEQVMFNMDFGKAYSSKSAKIHEYQLDACKRSYEWPVSPYPAEKVRSMGIDVNVDLNVVIRERDVFEGQKVRKALLITTVSTFDELSSIIKRWRPTKFVIDAQPELHKVSELKKEFPTGYSSKFVHDQIEMKINKNDRIVTMDRTSLLDAVKSAIDSESLILPNVDKSQLGGGSYYTQMTASARIVDVNEDDPAKSRFVWFEGAKPDHYFLAEAYCLQADLLCPESDVFDYFNEVLNSLQPQGDAARLTEAAGKALSDNYIDIMSPEDLEKSTISQEQFLCSLDRKIELGKSRPQRDLRSIQSEIQKVADLLYNMNAEIDLQAFIRSSGISVSRAPQILLQLGYVQIRDGFYGREKS